MNNILDILVEAILNSDLYNSVLSGKSNPELMKPNEELDKWVQSHFLGLKENDLAYEKIDDVICAREQWMLKNGIIIGMQIVMEGMYLDCKYTK